MKEVTYNSSLLKDSWNSNETVKPNNFNELSGAVKNVIANANDLAHNYLQQGKQYVAGDIVYSKNLNKGCYLLCKQGGTTGDSEPQLINKNVGETVKDGTVVWTVQKVGDALTVNETKILDNNKKLAASIYDFATQEEAEDGTNNDKVMTPLRVKQAMDTMTFIDLLPVGWVSYKEFLLPSHVKANGATVNRSDYPTLAAYATEHNLWTDDPASEPYKYGRGDGSTTMVLPDYRNRVIQGGDSPAVLEAGLPNIMGTLKGLAYRNNYFGVGTGVFSTSRSDGSSALTLDGTATDLIEFNATNSNSIYGASNTVQPPAIVLIPQIKY